jgi:hypothetical protein
VADINPLPIHTSDRGHYLKCRRAWNWQSPLGEYLTRIRKPGATDYLDFGSAIHAGLECWYDPLTWRLVVEGGAVRQTVQDASIVTFQQYWRDAKKEYLTSTKQDALDPEDEDEFKEMLALGVGMLLNYFQHSIKFDIPKWEPVAVEVPFEVPIMAPAGFDGGTKKVQVATFDDEFPSAVKDQLVAWRDGEWRPVVYRGRIDLIMRRLSDGAIYLWDHKTAGRLEENVEWLELDEQMGSYGWVYLRVAGQPPHGVIYSELYKGVPDEPMRLQNTRKGCNFSTSKSQDTSLSLFVETVKTEDTYAYEHGYYNDYIQWLQAEGKQYFRRTEILRNRHEYEAIGDRVGWQAIEMLSEPPLYPNPTKWNCQYCDFRTPCLQMNDGSDYQFTLNQIYRKRVS